MIIYVVGRFLQEPSDTVLRSFGYAAKLSVSDATPYKKWLATEAELASLKALEIRLVSTEKQQTVYKFYPADKQAQDEKWASNYSTKLRAIGLSNLDLAIISAAYKVSAGTSLVTAAEEILATVNADSLQLLGKVNYEANREYALTMLVKLIKIAFKTEWIEKCLSAVDAINAGKQVAIPEFPNFTEV